MLTVYSLLEPDVDLVNIRYIVKGRQAVDVWKMIDPLAETAAEVAVKLARNPERRSPK